MLQLTLITRQNRFDIVRRCTGAIESCGGWVLNHQQFANRAICLQFEIHRHQLPALLTALALTAPTPPGNPQERLAATLHIQFIHDEPDIPVIIPNG